MRRAIKVLLFALALAWPGLAAAQSCTATTAPVAFGTYRPFDATATTGTGTVTVRCNHSLALLLTYTINLSQGSSGTYAQRTLTSGTARLNYQLYTNLTRTAVWGDGSAGTGNIVDGVLLQALIPLSRSYTVYGLAPARQNVMPGSYSDPLVVTIVY